tara:strand:- start:532 stop:984 length:453 start_codon:yes stop_codon:yes gene_type:complete
MRRSSSITFTQFSQRGNPRRYTLELEQPDFNSELQQHMLDTISGRHIQFRPRTRRNAIAAPPDLLGMLTDLMESEMTDMNREAIVDTIPVYTAEGDLDDCTICQDKIKKGDQFRRLPCGVTVNHCFHKDCIDPWLKNNSTCPNCRSNLRD